MPSPPRATLVACLINAAVIGDVGAGEEVLVKFIKMLVVALLCIASLVVLLAVVLPIAASLFLGLLEPGVGIDLPFSLDSLRKSGLSIPILGSLSSLVLGLLIVFGCVSWRLARSLRPKSCKR